jgi:thioredoxin reductase (NADPH)
MPDAPVLLIVDDDPQANGVVESELRKRYGADYEIIRVGSADDPLRVLASLRDDRRRISIVLAGQSMAQITGTELLARVREFHGTAKRLLLTDGGYGPAQESILQAMAFDHIDAYAARPSTVPDERFHLAITQLLDQWARSHLPRFEVVRVVGEEWSARSHELRDLADRNSVPYGFYPADTEPGKALLRQAGVTAPLPVIILFDGRVLVNPTNAEIAEALGIKTRPGPGLYDVAVIGAGPAGLAAAVYGASEGLATILSEETALGGQAGTSSRIENLLGFPAGLSGEELAARAALQAQKFGARIKQAARAVSLSSAGGLHQVSFDDGDTVQAKSVIIATGAHYNRLPLDRLAEFEGVGVYYAATQVEAQACGTSPVAVVGGGNSAGQAALFLSRSCAQVHIIIRGDSLEASMSRYLTDRIEQNPRIVVWPRTQVTALTGTGELQGVRLGRDGHQDELPVRGLFVFIGAKPRTGWLDGQLAEDSHGFLLTGTDIPASGFGDRATAPLFLETSRPGIFAVGDVRSGSVKRAAAAIGEGSMAVRLVFDRLQSAGSADPIELGTSSPGA